MQGYLFLTKICESYPGWHPVSVRIAVVEVEDEDCEQDTAGHHAHYKVEICPFIETLSSLIGVIGVTSNKRIIVSVSTYLLREQHHWLLASVPRQYS